MSGARKAALALAGGVGGAKLAAGLQHTLGDALTVVVNTGDDFEHLGLHISPDLDTVMFTLAGVANKSQGWGLEGETWNFMAQLERLGGSAWFRLGDKDIANHLLRTSRLAEGLSLSQMTQQLCDAYGVRAKLLPMSDDPVRTIVHSGELAIPFQEYFVKLQCGPRVDRLEFRGASTARMNALLGCIAPGSLEAVVFCPSNPYLSIDPILSIPGVREWLRSLGAPVVAVSPIVAGTAIKGPAAKIMRELGHEPSAATVAAHYRGIIDGLLIDTSDMDLQGEIEALGIAVRVTNTVMKSDADRITLAEESLRFAREVSKR
ncbi:MAG: 2-phospho-L-lactate transferase [Xanthobacteraceae bacterium]|nr:2-phospho-L-lactate transferase [Xanthobacteraceae bacterium]MCW5674598.1 2-phospho-L-lactate transferase [Xanthobacteraceae bacterium]